MVKNLLCIVALILFLSSCAMIVKDSRQQVFFKGGVENGVTKVSTPDGTFEIENGAGAYLMTRSKPNIPLKITCPDGSKKNAQAETRFDWIAGGLGNIWNYFIGSIFDAMSDKSYNIDDISLQNYCKS